MPRVNQIRLVEISPDEFLEACSPQELARVERLIHTERFQSRIQKQDGNT